MADGGEKTEKATPKRREEARKKGQVAKSADLNGAVVMMAGLITLGITGPAAANRIGAAMRGFLQQAADPSVVAKDKVGHLILQAMSGAALAVAPIVFACMMGGILVNVLQVGLKPSAQALKPDPKRINPLKGAKNLVGPHSLVELVKSLSKVGIVGAVVFSFLAPQISKLAAGVGMDPVTLAGMLTSDIRAIAMRAAAAYLVIGIADFFYARHRHEKSLRMDLQEIKEEHKGHSLPAEVRGAMRRRQMQNARARMMQAVPEADVVVVNPTHFAVALKYDNGKAAPHVVAKGQDLVALKIKEIAREAGVPILEDKPLARGLYAAVEVEQMIPEELYAAVAEVLAWVYRTRHTRAA
jgi:flagellar biosynthesis protein FlhB